MPSRPQKNTQRPVERPDVLYHNVLVVCHGNICRSPLAAAILSKILGVERVRSAGLKPNASGPAAKKVREYAADLGIDLSSHRAREVSQDDISWGSVIVYMDGGNRKRLDSFQLGVKPLVCLAEYLPKPALRIADPGFLPRGAVLTELLNSIVIATENFARQVIRL